MQCSGSRAGLTAGRPAPTAAGEPPGPGSPVPAPTDPGAAARAARWALSGPVTAHWRPVTSIVLLAASRNGPSGRQAAIGRRTDGSLRELGEEREGERGRGKGGEEERGREGERERERGRVRVRVKGREREREGEREVGRGREGREERRGREGEQREVSIQPN